MATSYGALCTDFSVNHKLAMKMDLPGDRETILHLFDRVRKAAPSMDRFHPYENELALESPRRDPQYRCLALRRRSIRTIYFNPPTMAKAYDFHRMLMEVAPYHLTISPLDVDYAELVFGFDLECRGNHDEVVFEALMGQSPVGELLRVPGAKILDVQPYYHVGLEDGGNVQAIFEVKTRHRSRRGSSGRYRHEPISLFLIVRKYGPAQKVEDLQTDLDVLAKHAEYLATERFVPHLLTPIARQITSSSA